MLKRGFHYELTWNIMKYQFVISWYIKISRSGNWIMSWYNKKYEKYHMTYHEISWAKYQKSLIFISWYFMIFQEIKGSRQIQQAKLFLFLFTWEIQVRVIMVECFTIQTLDKMTAIYVGKALIYWTSFMLRHIGSLFHNWNFSVR